MLRKGKGMCVIDLVQVWFSEGTVVAVLTIFKSVLFSFSRPSYSLGSALSIRWVCFVILSVNFVCFLICLGVTPSFMPRVIPDPMVMVMEHANFVLQPIVPLPGPVTSSACCEGPSEPPWYLHWIQPSYFLLYRRWRPMQAHALLSPSPRLRWSAGSRTCT